MNLAPDMGSSMLCRFAVSLNFQPDRSFLPWWRKFRNFNSNLAITQFLWEI